MRQKVESKINHIIEVLKNEQSSDGSWGYPFETGISTDAYMIILLRSLEIDDKELIQSLVKRILSKQEPNGAWKLFHDEVEGNLTATVEAYYALLYSGYLNNSDKEIIAAKERILSLGGIEKSHMFSKIMLSLTGQYKWPKSFPIPVEIMLLPISFPINLYDFSVYGRANIVPILIASDKKYHLRTENNPDLSDLFVYKYRDHDDYLDWNNSAEWRSIHSLFLNELKKIIGFPAKVHTAAIKQAEKYMLDRIESDGTLYSYFSSTFLMIFALLSLGYQKNDSIISKAVNGLKSMASKIDSQTHMQYTTANVWNTALISYSLQQAGVSPNEQVLKRANDYLLSRQHYRYGDWSVHNRNSLPGGWGFSNINSFNPDVDDTTASLRAISRFSINDPLYRQAWDRGINWLLTMQNNDGGWAAFEKNVNKSFLNLLPIQGGKFLLTDPSTPDLTGRTLEFFGNYTNLKNNHHSIKHAVHWLIQQQERDGSWYGRWGICYIYGTWAAVTGLISVGVSPSHYSIQKALKWLIAIQNSDGGWGESCYSDINNTYTPLKHSTLTHTAWALDALITCAKKPIPAIEKGIEFLLESHNKLSSWHSDYPTGQGMAGGFYIHYHSYNYIFPLLTLSHYRNKYL